MISGKQKSFFSVGNFALTKIWHTLNEIGQIAEKLINYLNFNRQIELLQPIQAFRKNYCATKKHIYLSG